MTDDTEEDVSDEETLDREPEDADYRKALVQNLWAIHQDKKDSDCGPTCGVFFRFGGVGAASNKPSEGMAITRSNGMKAKPTAAARDVYGGTVQDLCVLMRQESSAPKNEGEGTDFGAMTDVLNRFAGVIGGQRYEWKSDQKDYGSPPDDPKDPMFKVFFQSMGSDLQLTRLGPKLGGLGCLINIVAAQNGASYGTLHWVVVTDANDPPAVFDPGFPGTHQGAKTDRNWTQLALLHASGSQNMGRITSKFIYPSPVTSGGIKSGTVLGGLDVKGSLSTWGRIAKANEDATWYASPEEADFHAEDKAWSNSTGCAVVVERPSGCFAVVGASLEKGHFFESSDAGSDFATKATVDSDGSPDGSTFKEVNASIVVFLKYKDEMHRIATGRFHMSVRWNDQGKAWKLYSP